MHAFFCLLFFEEEETMMVSSRRVFVRECGAQTNIHTHRRVDLSGGCCAAVKRKDGGSCGRECVSEGEEGALACTHEKDDKSEGSRKAKLT